MLKCPRCGEENRDRELYCAGCQTRLPSISALRSTIRNGLEALDEKDYRKAMDRFTDVVRQNPGDLDAWFLLSATKVKLGRGSEAWEDLVEVGLAAETGRCTHCRGSGKCKECGGPGICIMCRGTKKCSYCGGTGACPTCRGQRPDECNHCKGTGQCIRCKGSAECNYCSGYGNCAKCKGTGKCVFCGGTGLGHELDLSKVSREFHELANWF
ncbi:MAG: tetratricopeptide repeat protein [Thermoplasmatota archaeon]